MDNKKTLEYYGLEISPFGPPNLAGVYAVCTRCVSGDEIIWYIGSASNIYKRVLSKAHPYLSCFSSGRHGQIYLRTKPMPKNSFDTIRRFEARLILEFQPILNIKHK